MTGEHTLVDITALAEQYGWPVFPCNAKKEPLTTHGFKDATRDVEQIRAWAAEFPACLWGVPTGAASRLLVLDIDRKNGVNGEAALDALVAKNGALPKTVEALTPTGGRHLYFAHPDVQTKSTASDIGKGLDVRGDGGYACVPPSSGYVWGSDPADTGFAEPPQWLVALVRVDVQRRDGGRSQGADGTDEIPEGARDSTLTSLAGKMRRAGMAEGEIYAALEAINTARCKPPLSAKQVSKIAASVARYKANKNDPGEPLDILRAMSAPPLRCADVPPVLGAFADTYARASGHDVSMPAAAMLNDGVRLCIKRAGSVC